MCFGCQIEYCICLFHELVRESCVCYVSFDECVPLFFFQVLKAGWVGADAYFVDVCDLAVWMVCDNVSAEVASYEA